jgi:hypothetical protein
MINGSMVRHVREVGCFRVGGIEAQTIVFLKTPHRKDDEPSGSSSHTVFSLALAMVASRRLTNGN